MSLFLKWFYQIRIFLCKTRTEKIILPPTVKEVYEMNEDDFDILFLHCKYIDLKRKKK